MHAAGVARWFCMVAWNCAFVLVWNHGVLGVIAGTCNHIGAFVGAINEVYLHANCVCRSDSNVLPTLIVLSCVTLALRGSVESWCRASMVPWHIASTGVPHHACRFADKKWCSSSQHPTSRPDLQFLILWRA